MEVTSLDYFRSVLSSINKVTSDKIFIYGEPYTISKFKKSSHCPSVDNISKEVIVEFELFDPQRWAKFSNDFFQLLIKQKREEIKDIKYNGEEILIYRDVTTDELLTYSTTYKVFRGFHPNFIYKEMGAFNKDEKESLTRDGKVIYDPRIKENIYEGNFLGKNLDFLNTYEYPKWMDRAHRRGTKPNPLFLEFFDYFFKDKQSKNYSLNWVRRSIFERNQTYLTMISHKGIGKSSILAPIVRYYHGAKNFKTAQKRLFEEGFNSALRNCTMILVDDTPINDEEKMSSIKHMSASKTVIEEKGKDVGDEEEVFFSTMIFVNDIKDLPLTDDDRLFSTPYTTDISLINHPEWGTDKLKELVDLLNDESEMDILCWYIHDECNFDEAYPNSKPFKNDKFFALLIEGLYDWKKQVIQKVLNENDYINISKGDIKNIHISTIQKFIKDFTYRGNKVFDLVLGKSSNGEYKMILKDSLRNEIKDVFKIKREELNVNDEDIL